MFQTTNQSSLHTYHHIVAPLPGILSWSLMITTTIWVITSDPCMAGSQRWGERAAPSNKKQRSLKWGRSSTNMRLTHVNYVCGWMPPLIHGLLSGCVSPTEGVHWFKKTRGSGDPAGNPTWLETFHFHINLGVSENGDIAMANFWGETWWSTAVFWVNHQTHYLVVSWNKGYLQIFHCRFSIINQPLYGYPHDYGNLLLTVWMIVLSLNFMISCDFLLPKWFSEFKAVSVSSCTVSNIRRVECSRRKHYWLVVGPPLWQIWKSIGMISNPIFLGKSKMATKPPTSYYIQVVFSHFSQPSRFESVISPPRFRWSSTPWDLPMAWSAWDLIQAGWYSNHKRCISAVSAIKCNKQKQNQ